MRQMKDSGIEWIGQIPQEWEVKRFKSCFLNIQSGCWGNDSSGDQSDCICLRIADFDYENFKFKNGSSYTVRNYGDVDLEKLLLVEGDLLVEKSGGGEKTPVGRVVIYDLSCKAVYANFMDRLRCKTGFNPYWMNYVFATFYGNGYTFNYVKQTTGIQNLDLKSLLSIEFLPLPSTYEQQAIADKLNKVCNEIDNVITKTKATVEEYKKLKQAIITEAVTGKKQCVMRNSQCGIKEKWTEIKLKWVFEFGKGLPITKENLLESGLSVINYGQIHSRINSGIGLKNELERFVDKKYLETNADSLVHKGDFIFADTSEDLDGCGNCVYVDKEKVLFGGYHTIILKCKNEFNGKYLAYLFSSDFWRQQLRANVFGIKVFSVTQKILKETVLLLPNQLEQQEIVAYLDAKCGAIDNLITKKQQLITEMENYKKSVIYEYVTGKKEVG